MPTVHEDADYARAALDAGGLGYVVKARLASDLLPAIRAASLFNSSFHVDATDVLSHFLQVKDEKHPAGFEIAQLENEIEPGLLRVQFIKHRPFFRRKGQRTLNLFFVCEVRTPLERLHLVSFKDNETLALILRVTANARLSTTTIYVNLIDMHAVDNYTQNWVEGHSRVDSKWAFMHRLVTGTRVD